jgi:biopolymer transport protein TolR
MALAKRDEGSKVNSDINVTPMVDVMLVLLIIFMVITPLLQKGVSVVMATSANHIAMQEADKDDAVLISITKDGAIYLGSNKVTPEEVTVQVREKLEKKTSKQVFVKADARAHYGAVVDVVDDVRSAGVDDLGLLTEPNRTPPPPPSPDNKNKPATPGT